MRAISVLLMIVFCTASFNALSRRVAPKNNLPPGGMSLLAGYEHKQLQGIDSVPGEIAKKDGLKINYETGRVTKPGQPRMGGDFNDSAKNMPAKNRKWYKEQVVNGPTGPCRLRQQRLPCRHLSQKRNPLQR